MSNAPTTVVFDIGGTLVDETTSMVGECVAVLGQELGEEGAERFAEGWQQRFGDVLARVAQGEAPWEGTEPVRRRILKEVLAEHGLPREGREYAALRGVGDRLVPFDDAARGLDALASVATIVGLTNTDLAASSAAGFRAGFRWHALLSTEFARSFKPRPEAYALVERHLGVDPARSYFVAAHPWDLRAAAERGYRTVYLPRPHALQDAEPGEFDHEIQEVGDLLAIVAAPRVISSTHRRRAVAGCEGEAG